MAGLLQTELRQSIPFASAEVEAYLNLLRTVDHLQRRHDELLKPHGLSGTGYNILRILRGAGADGLPCGEIAARLVTHDPDITRLLDRMEARGWVTRQRSTVDRRQVIAMATAEGIAIADRLAPLLVVQHRAGLGHLGEERLRLVIELMEAIRTAPS